jgi:hypothetical protein
MVSHARSGNTVNGCLYESRQPSAVSRQYSAKSQKLSFFVVPARAWVLLTKKGFQLNAESLDYLSGVPKGIRTPVAGVKGRCPGPG